MRVCPGSWKQKRLERWLRRRTKSDLSRKTAFRLSSEPIKTAYQSYQGYQAVVHMISLLWIIKYYQVLLKAFEKPLKYWKPDVPFQFPSDRSSIDAVLETLRVHLILCSRDNKFPTNKSISLNININWNVRQGFERMNPANEANKKKTQKYFLTDSRSFD